LEACGLHDEESKLHIYKLNQDEPLRARQSLVSLVTCHSSLVAVMIRFGAYGVP